VKFLIERFSRLDRGNGILGFSGQHSRLRILTTSNKKHICSQLLFDNF
jgi:hypothetical protein